MKWLKPLVIGLFVLMFLADGYQVYRIAFVRHEADFPAYLAGAEGLRSGTNPYIPTPISPYSGTDIRPFIYPLFIAWLWVPFTFIPAVAGSFVWYFLSFAMMLYAIHVVSQLVGITNTDHKWIVFGVIGILFMSVFQWVLMFGQMDFFELLLLVIAAKYLIQNKARGGAFLGAAISAKLMPVVVLPMVLRNWKALFIAVGASIIVCIIVPYLIAGNAIFGYYDYWFHTTLGGEMAKGDEAIHSFALAGVVAQCLGLLRPTLAIKLASGIFLLLFPLWLLFKHKMLPALFLSFMLIPLTSTRSEPNHLTMLVPAVMLIASTLILRKIKWGGKEKLLSTKQAAIGWALLVILQAMILWGYNALVPYDTIGMLAVFSIVFCERLRSDPAGGTVSA